MIGPKESEKGRHRKTWSPSVLLGEGLAEELRDEEISGKEATQASSVSSLLLL